MRKNGTEREIARRIDNNTKYDGKQKRQHEGEGNTSRKNITIKNMFKRERAGQNKKEGDKSRKTDT